MIPASQKFRRLAVTNLVFGAACLVMNLQSAQASGWIEQSIKAQKEKQAPPPAPPPKPVQAKPKPEAQPKAPAKAPSVVQAMEAIAKDAGGGVDRCAQTPELQKFFGCISQRLDKLADDLEKGPATKPAAPQTIAAIRTAAKEVKAATTKDEAVSALQKASAVITAAMAATKGDTVDKFGPKVGVEAVAGTLNKAIAAVQKSI